MFAFLQQLTKRFFFFPSAQHQSGTVSLAKLDHQTCSNLWNYLWNLTSLTPSLLQTVTFPGWKMLRCACKQYIFQSCNICFECYAFWWKSFHTPVQKRRQKGLRVSDFALLWVVFKWNHGSEGVKLPYVCVCVRVCVCACVRVCVHACSQKFVLIVFCSLLCNGLCAPIWRNST